MSNNAVNPFGAEALSIYLTQATSLQKLIINNCGLGPLGTTTIAKSLQKGTPNLKVLAIARNRAENPGGEAIGEALSNLPKLTELHIFQDVIREPGMVPILSNLALYCKDLETLDIRDNFLGGSTVDLMAEVIL